MSARALAVLLAVLSAALLAACAASVDADQERVCRSALPALNPDGRVRVLRAGRGPLPASLRLDYRVERAGAGPLARWAVCQFAGEGLALGKADLVGLTTERGPLTGASLYLLKRYYVDTPDGVAGDPGRDPGRGAGLDPGADRDGADRDGADPGLPEVPPVLAYAAQSLFVGLPRIGLYALLSAAYALVFGLVGRVNLAFGEVAAVGGLAVAPGVALAGLAGATGTLAGLAAGTVLAVAAAALHGTVGGWLTLARVRGAQASLIATVGLSLALSEYLRLAGGATVWLPPIGAGAVPVLRAEDGGRAFVAGVSPTALAVAAVSLLAAAGLLAVMGPTRFGRAWRAYSDDPRAAALFGVDGAALLRRTLALSGGLAGLAGALVAVQFGAFGFAAGFAFGLKALIAAVLGGIGSVPGALVGGAVLGLFETAWSALLPIDSRDAALYALLVVVLVLRPGGLFGFGDPTRPRAV